MAAERLFLQSVRDGVARLGERVSLKVGRLTTDARLVDHVASLGSLPNRLRDEQRKALARAEKAGRDQALALAAGLHRLATRLETAAQPSAAPSPAELH